MKAYITGVEGTCGLEVIYNYEGCSYYEDVKDLYLYGTGFVVFGFINNKICREMYKEMKKYFKIVYQSPVRHNPNSGNKFFFVIADKKKVK